jgi:rare lipoprotein A
MQQRLPLLALATGSGFPMRRVGAAGRALVYLAALAGLLGLATLGEREGRPVARPAIAWAQSGPVSWYGPGFHGRTTANGEIFDTNELTMAHRSLAFGSRVRVTNLENGRTVVVRVNDRGPYVRGRVADLSRAAAKRLEFVDDGVVRARIELL